jgi:hypothetical protein
MKAFERAGVRFLYPANWAADAEDDGDGWTVTVQSPDTAFVMVSLRPDADDPSSLVDEALAALRAEYPGLDADPVVASVAGIPAVGHDIDFLTLDSGVSCWTRCVDTTAGPLLVMGQCGEYERPRNEPLLLAILASLTIAD